MVETIGRTDTPKESIENLLHVRQLHFPDQPIDWEYLLDEFVKPSDFCTRELFPERMCFLVMCGMSERVNGLAFKVWRDHIIQMIYTLWKNRINENQHTTINRRKKIKTGDASIRWQCRVTCGADVIIGHVLPYLISTGNDESLS